jgi:tetratricopeptide (TPR) repeat protein
LAQAETELAEGRLREAIASFQRYHGLGPDPEALYGLARVYDRMGQVDSARIYYQRAVDAPSLRRLISDAIQLAPALKRLGELYEARGDDANAAKYYNRLVDLWHDADPALQPTVRDIRQRLARFTAEQDR